MRNRNATIGLMRTLPRYSGDAQRKALTEAGCEIIFDLSERDRVTALNAVRVNATVYVWRMHLLAERTKDRTHSPRRDLFWWTRYLLARGAVVVELATNARATDAESYLLMLEEACEEATKGIRGRARRTSRENGKAGGRPKKEYTDEQIEAARSIWFDRAIVGDDEVRKALRRFRTGFYPMTCRRKFGPRGGQ